MSLTDMIRIAGDSFASYLSASNSSYRLAKATVFAIAVKRGASAHNRRAPMSRVILWIARLLHKGATALARRRALWHRWDTIPDKRIRKGH